MDVGRDSPPPPPIFLSLPECCRKVSHAARKLATAFSVSFCLATIVCHRFVALKIGLLVEKYQVEYNQLQEILSPSPFM